MLISSQVLLRGRHHSRPAECSVSTETSLIGLPPYDHTLLPAHHLLKSTHASAGNYGTQIVLEREKGRETERERCYFGCIISKSGRPSCLPVPELMKKAIGNLSQNTGHLHQQRWGLLLSSSLQFYFYSPRPMKTLCLSRYRCQMQIAFDHQRVD